MIQPIRAAARCAFAVALLLPAAVAGAAEQPNVVLMMADDLGYGDLSCYGSDRMRTPELDKLASEGIRLTSFYAGATVCTPSRMALLTGAYPTRVGWPGGVIRHRISGSNGLAPEARTMAEVFQDAGYATGISGKWHLGETAELLPMNQGFDSAYYIKNSNNQSRRLWRGEEVVANPFDNRRLTERFTSEAIRFVRANRARPFFLYIPFTAPHFPAQAHPDWKGASSNDAYGDVVEELDSRIGEILGVLESEGLDRNTIVVFLSDNGPDPSQRRWASAEPFRGLKWSSIEGGTRVPCIVRWPGVIPANRESDALIAAIDLLPTLAHACGIDVQRGDGAKPKRDGVNVWDTLIGSKDAPHARSTLLYWNGWAGLEAVRVGEWKLFLTEVEGIANGDGRPALFHLKSDPAEETNVAERHPERVEAMQRIAEELVADIEANTIPLGGPPANRP